MVYLLLEIFPVVGLVLFYLKNFVRRGLSGSEQNGSLVFVVWTPGSSPLRFFFEVRRLLESYLRSYCPVQPA